MCSYIQKLIEQGENQQLDFKFCITDSKKIARTLSAFSNTYGGKLLIGVKDNGIIAGIHTEEELFMIEGAAKLYCKPEVNFSSKKWNINGKTILEITIPKGNKKPYLAPYKQGKWMAYIRVKDQNLLANSVLLKVWKRKKRKKGTFVKYTDKEKFLLKYLEKNQNISLSKFYHLAHISRYKAENILVNFIVLHIIEIIFSEKNIYYRLKIPIK